MSLPKPPTAPRLAFLLTVLVALGFALWTQHAWEDYYITYRSSKNLATGHGLVFNLGDRLHTFTSPLGVLLPAVASVLTANTSDPGALWIFRVMCAAALGGAAYLSVRSLQGLNYARPAVFFLVAWLVTDAKTVDFTINGMETAFMLLFLAYALWAHLNPGPRSAWHLGGAWAGLMWTRPDSFIYIGLIAAGFWLFPGPVPPGTPRRQMLGLYVRAGLVTTLLYLPWLVFAQLYYGTAIPHTIIAKSGFGEPHTLTGLLRMALRLPFTTTDDANTLAHTFLPAYFMIGGWPAPLIMAARVLGILCAVAWLLPRVRRVTRVASFAFFGSHVYLSYFPYFPFPWYLPSTTFLAFITLSSLVNQALDPAAPGRWRWVRRITVGLAAGLLAGTTWTIWQAGRQLAAQQHYIEDGTRRKIGEWLHAHAQPGDTVFMEPLGYIGFFSGLKTYDFPGMSSREMVAARARVGNDWSALIQELEPKWLVLRPFEAARVEAAAPGLLAGSYQPVQTFDQKPAVRLLDVRGRNYLENDATFTIYHGEHLLHLGSKTGKIISPFPTSRLVIDGVGVTLVHAPSSVSMTVPKLGRTMNVSFGFPPGAYAPGKGPGDTPTDGATFSIELRDQGQTRVLESRRLDPVNNPADRGIQRFQLALPPHADDALLILRALPGNTMTKDWTCWGSVEFR